MTSRAMRSHTNGHTVRGRPTPKVVKRFRNGSVGKAYERSIYEGTFRVTSSFPGSLILLPPGASEEALTQIGVSNGFCEHLGEHASSAFIFKAPVASAGSTFEASLSPLVAF